MRFWRFLNFRWQPHMQVEYPEQGFALANLAKTNCICLLGLTAALRDTGRTVLGHF